MKGPCAKAHVTCTITAEDGREFVGSNWCGNAQSVCPRELGEGYEKCKSICQQQGHAEEDAVRLAGDAAQGSTAVLRGHTYACMNCQHAMFGAGVKSFSVEEKR